ncbi:MAG TPA: polysaccharide biosynthesis tyrosine autokinase [Gemmatimonadales bacterium]|nr:polysaccharide biosynthesis tyrosine autokinase [Gemmatimonadales bacterium]
MRRVSGSASGAGVEGVQPYARSPEEWATDWRRYVSAVLRFRWWVLVVTVLGALAGVAATRFLPTRYQAQTTIWIQATEPRGADRGPIGANQLLAASAWGDLLKSYLVLDAVVQEQRLYLGANPRDLPALATFTVREQFRPGRYRFRVDKTGQTFRLEAEKGVELEQGTVGDSVGRALGFVWAPPAAVLPPGSEVSFAVAPLRDAAKGLADELRVTVDPSGNFLRVTLMGGSGAGAAATANAVAGRYVAVATELKRAKLTELARLLSEQLQAAAANLRRAEASLEDFRARTITLTPDPGAPAALAVPRGGSPMGEFFTLKVEAEQLRRDREALGQVLVQMQQPGGSVDGLAPIGAVQRSADLSQALRELTTKRADRRALEYRYTPDHPALRRVVGEIDVLERRTIPALAQALVIELGARERVLASQLEAGGHELREIPQRTIEEARRRRDVTIAENLFTSVQQRYSEARLAEASSIADVRVLDAAVAPQAPVKETGSHLIALGLIAGLGLALMGAVLVDRFDPRVRYPEQVTHEMGLRILGVLPHVQNRAAGPDDEHVIQVIEAMRSVRLSLMHAYGAAGPVLLTVSSPGVGDGKSFVSTNLALACAQAGQRTLLIDGDARRGALHRVLQGKRKPGLTDFLAGSAPLEAVTQGTSYRSLHFIGAGSRFHDSPELLGSPAMLDLLTRLRGAYDVILIDSPPLGSGVDPYTLSTLTGNMLLVLRTGTTNRDLTRTKLAVLEDLPIRLLGAVLNDVRPGGMYGYYGYLSGYATTDEGRGGMGAAVVTARQKLGGRYRL